MGQEPLDIDLLLISDLYPTPHDPVRGVFVRDHARALRPFVRSVTVANISLIGEACRIRQDETDPHIRVLQGGIFRRKIHRAFRSPFYAIWVHRALRTILEHADPDLLHAHGGVLSGTLARRIATKKRIPYFITEHFRMLEKWAKDPLKRRLLAKNHRGAARTIGVSEQLTREIRTHFPEGKSLTVPNPVDTELFHPGTEEREKRLLFASRLDPQKGALRTLKAFEAVHGSYPDWKLKIQGEGRERAAIEAYLAERPSLKERVEVGPKLPREELVQAMRRSAFMVLPSEYESFGLVIAESLATGTPVIAPDRTGPRDIFFEGAGIGIDPRNEESLMNAMQRMIETAGSTDPEELHKGIAERFSMDRVGRQLQALYQKALNS
ncbi:MAG: glycosyltransferase [Flavobacteriales bacterium]